MAIYTTGTDRTRSCTDKGTNAATNMLPNGPECATKPTRSQMEQWADDAAHLFRKGLHQIASATNWIDTRSAIGSLLGDKSFTAGVAAGMAENLVETVVDLGKMIYMLTLADVYECRHAPTFWQRLGAEIRLATNPAGRNLLMLASFSKDFDLATQRAFEERKVLFAAVYYAFENPREAFGKIAESQKKKFQQFAAYKERHTLAGEFHAGVLFGGLVMDVLMIIDGVTAIAKIAAKVPGAAKLLLNLRKVTPTVKAAGAGAEAAAGARAAEKGAAEGAEGAKGAKAGEAAKGKEPTKKGESEKDGIHCPLKGKPVDSINGCKVLFDAMELDFDLPAPLALPWQRNYSSDNGRISWLGQGWHLPISLALEFSDQQITLLDGLNRGIAFSHIPVGESIYSRHEQITLSRQDLLRFELVDSDDVRNQFHLPTPNAKRAHLVKRIDRNGNIIRIDYNEQQQPTRVIDSAGRILALAFNPQQRLTSVSQIDLEGSSESVTLVEYDYDEAGDLIRVRNRAGQTTREFAYRNHLMVKHAQPGGLVSEYDYSEYQPSGKVLRNHTNTGLSWQFSYGKNHTMVTDNLGRKTQTAFNDDKRYLGGLDALGGQAVRDLDAYGNLIAYTDEAGHTTRYQYDTRSRLTRIEDPDGAVTQISYDMRFDKPVSITNAAGGITRLRYDPYANLSSIVDPLGQTTQYRVDQRGLPVEIIDARGGSKKLEYNRAGQVTRYTDCSGQTSRFEYDRFGNLTQSTDALNHSTRYQYDEAGRLQSAHYPDGSSEQYQYDQLGRLTGHTDALGQQTRYQFDAEGRLEQRTNALGHSLSYHYDAAKRLAQLVNENGAVYAFEYDALDRLRQETGFDARTTRYDYDLAGKPKTKIELGQVRGDGSGNPDNSIRTEFQRDVMGRLTAKTVSGAQHASAMVNRYQYDTLGRLTHATNPSATVELEYDAIGQLRAEKSRMPSGNDILHSVLRHSYDELGNRTQTVLPDGRTLNLLYYGSGHLHQINIDGEVISDIERDNKHREISRSQGALTSRFQYDPVGRLSAQIAQLDPTRTHSSLAQQREAWQGADGALAGEGSNNRAIIARQYQYDLAGNLIAQNDQRFGKTVYQYDAIGRILGAAQPNLSETFAFDPAHNLLDPASMSAGTSAGRVENNQLTVFEDKRFAYDAHGNLIDKKIGKHTQIELVWNAVHQLVQSRVSRNTGADNPTRQSTEYGYDPFGRRVFKRDAFGETRFVWDGNRLLAETRGSHTRTYLYEAGSVVPLAQIDSGPVPAEANKPKAEVRYFHTDHLGTPRELTDGGGNVQWAASYKAWGNVLRVKMAQVQTTPEAESTIQTQALRFQGQYFDVETGLHYNRFRYYDPDIGRFVSQDPIKLWGGNNLYQYAANPVNWIDPLGLVPDYVHPVANDWLSKGLHGTFNDVELSIKPTHNGGITFEPVFSGENAAQTKKAISSAEKFFENPKNVDNALLKLEGGKDWYDQRGAGREWAEVKRNLNKISSAKKGEKNC